MARVDTQRAQGLGEPYQEGQTVEPTCDEYGRTVTVLVGGGGGGGGDASLAEQQAQTDILADQLAALTGLSQETTLALVKTAVETNGGKLDTLHSDLGALLTQATGEAILSQLQATGASVDSILSDTSGILTALGTLATGADVGAVETAVLDGNATLETISTAIASLATAAKQDELKAVADAMASSLTSLVTQTDEIEPDLEELAEQGRPANGGSILAFDATVTVQQLPPLPSPRGITIQVLSTAAGSAFFGYANTLTTSGSTRGWEIQPGASEFFDVDDASRLYRIADTTVECALRAEVRS